MFTVNGNEPAIVPYPREVSRQAVSAEFRGLAVKADGDNPHKAARILRDALDALGVPARGEYCVTLTQSADLAPRLGSEGYELATEEGGATLAASDYPGPYYGVQTLLQLLDPRSGGRFRLPCVQVVDWPLKPIRGVHCYLPAREDMPFFKRFIEWMGRHKLNTLFLEIGGGMEYARHSEINRAWERFCKDAMEYPGGPDALQASQWFPKDSTHTELAGGSFLTKDEVRRIAEWCGDNCIEIIPEVQSLSHSYYLVVAHPELAEMTEDPWPDNYCPSNPKSYQLYFDVLKEVIAVFNPRMISIGHDEAYLFNFCSKCKKRDAAEIYATDVIKAHDFLAERGIRTAMWGDKLLDIRRPDGRTYGGVARDSVKYGKRFHMPATSRCVDMIPRDVLVLDWYWSLSYESAEMLAEKGFEMIYGNFYGPKFEGWAKRRENPALLGGETSTWCAVDAYSLGRNGAFHTMLWSANNLWSDFDPDSDRGRLVSDIAAVMRRDRPMLAGIESVISTPGEKRQKPLDLTPAARAGFSSRVSGGGGLADLPRGRLALGGVDFLMPGSDENAVVVPSVDWHLRATPAIPVGQKVDAFAFLHTTSVDRVHAPTYYSLTLGPNRIGGYLITYEDGETVEVPLEYGVNIDSWNSSFMVGESGDQSPVIGVFVYQADPVLTGRTEAGSEYTLFMYEWRNPRPEIPIREVRLLWDAGYTEGRIALIALTALSV